MDQLITKIAKFLLDNLDKIAKWIINLIESIVNRPMPSYPTLTSLKNYVSSISKSKLEQIASLLGL